MSTDAAEIDRLTEELDSLESRLVETLENLAEAEYQQDQSENHNWNMAEAISQAIRDLDLIGEVPLSEVVGCVDLVIAALNAVR